MTTILTQVGAFLTAITGNAVTMAIVAVMVAGTIGRFAFKTVKRFIH